MQDYRWPIGWFVRTDTLVGELPNRFERDASSSATNSSFWPFYEKANKKLIELQFVLRK